MLELARDGRVVPHRLLAGRLAQLLAPAHDLAADIAHAVVALGEEGPDLAGIGAVALVAGRAELERHDGAQARDEPGRALDHAPLAALDVDLHVAQALEVAEHRVEAADLHANRLHARGMVVAPLAQAR